MTIIPNITRHGKIKPVHLLHPPDKRTENTHQQNKNEMRKKEQKKRHRRAEWSLWSCARTHHALPPQLSYSYKHTTAMYTPSQVTSSIQSMGGWRAGKQKHVICWICPRQPRRSQCCQLRVCFSWAAEARRGGSERCGNCVMMPGWLCLRWSCSRGGFCSLTAGARLHTHAHHLLSSGIVAFFRRHGKWF